MRKSLVILVCVLLAGAIFLVTQKGLLPDRDAIIVHHDGVHVTLYPDSPYYSEVRNESEELLVTSDDILKLIVTSETIRDLKDRDEYIEVIYSPSRPFTLSDNQILHLNRLLIPLFGLHQADSKATIYWGNPVYQSGPLVNSRGLSKIEALLQQVNQPTV